MERTLLIVKPDATARNLIGEIVRRVECSGFTVEQITKTRLGMEQARRFYAVHEGKPFFAGLCSYMCSGPIVPMVLAKENAVSDLRALIGATDPRRAACGTLRYDIGEDNQRNSVHASDAPESAEIEIAFFFGREQHAAPSH
jgi:nucleoside-diphosphate kinase